DASARAGFHREAFDDERFSHHHARPASSYRIRQCARLSGPTGGSRDGGVASTPRQFCAERCDDRASEFDMKIAATTLALCISGSLFIGGCAARTRLQYRNDTRKLLDARIPQIKSCYDA